VTTVSADILLIAVNARYSHSAHAARSLAANLGALARRADLLETDLDVSPLQLAAQIEERRPRVAGFSVYLWNVRIVEAAARILRAVSPEMRLVAGGPEITPDYANAAFFDAIVVGEGETAFRRLCSGWLSDDGDRTPQAANRDSAIVLADPEDPATLALPYDLYTEDDLARRTVYVEASRGCPYACSYCTSAGTGLRLLPLDRILPAFDRLWQRGLRRFKFLDRSFNAPAAHASAILDFFLDRVTPDTMLHLEINPDRLHASVASRLAAFPRGTLHLAVGVQTLEPRVAAAVGRSADVDATLDHVRFLTRETGASVHADLIFGLPGEDEDSFARGFDRLIEVCDPPAVQVNLLKGLPGTRLAREAASLGLVFSPEPSYELLRSDTLDFAALQRLQRFARCWELTHNRGRFPRAIRALHEVCGGRCFASCQALAARIHAEEGRLFALSPNRLARHLRAHLTEYHGMSATETDALLAADLSAKP